MRWPFGPPHLTLKPSKKTKHKKQTKKNTKKTQKKPKKNQNKERKNKKHKNTKKRAFQLSVKIIFFFWQGIQKLPFFDTLAQKTRTQKHYKNRGFSLFFWKVVMRHETAIFGPKKPKFINSSYHFFLAFFSLSKTKNTKICWNPYFCSVLANLKKRIFQKVT